MSYSPPNLSNQATHKKNLELHIAGEQFTFMVAAEDESTLRHAVKCVEQQVLERRQQATVRNNDRIALLVAIKTMSDLLVERSNRSQNLESIPNLDALSAKLGAMHTHADEVLAKLDTYAS